MPKAARQKTTRKTRGTRKSARIASQDEKPSAHTCSKCQKSFTTASGLSRHMRTHGDTFEYTCLVEGCGKGFHQPTQLVIHVDSVHKKVQRYACLHKCGKRFADPASCNRHERERHEPYRGFTCSIDGEKYNRRADFVLHFKKCYKRPPTNEELDDAEDLTAWLYDARAALEGLPPRPLKGNKKRKGPNPGLPAQGEASSSQPQTTDDEPTQQEPAVLEMQQASTSMVAPVSANTSQAPLTQLPYPMVADPAWEAPPAEQAASDWYQDAMNQYGQQAQLEGMFNQMNLAPAAPYSNPQPPAYMQPSSSSGFAHPVPSFTANYQAQAQAPGPQQGSTASWFVNNQWPNQSLPTGSQSIGANFPTQPVHYQGQSWPHAPVSAQTVPNGVDMSFGDLLQNLPPLTHEEHALFSQVNNLQGNWATPESRDSSVVPPTPADMQAPADFDYSYKTGNMGHPFSAAQARNGYW